MEQVWQGGLKETVSSLMLVKPPQLLTMFHDRWHTNYDDGYNYLSKVK